MELCLVKIESVALRGQLLVSRVAVVKPANTGKCDDLAVARGLHGSRNRRVLLESQVSPVLMEIVDVGPDDPPEVVLVERDDMIEAVPAGEVLRLRHFQC